MPSLFDHLPESWEQDDQAQRRVASVVVAHGAVGTYDYEVPAPLVDACQPGRRVRAPLGKSNRDVEGYCVEVAWRAVGSRRLKPLSAVLDERSLLSPAMLRLTQWIADYYLCPLATVIEAVVPAGVRVGAGTRPSLVLSIDERAVARAAQEKHVPAAAEGDDAAREAGEGAPRDGQRSAARTNRRSARNEGALSPKQAAVLRALREAGRPLALQELTRLAHCTAAPINVLRRKGLIRGETIRVETPHACPPPTPRGEQLHLNADQQHALDAILAAIRAAEHKTFLVHGVTGSGKTEVYIRAIEEVVSYGRQAIVLVPEISLTPQTVERFRARFSDVAVLHSRLTDAERHWHWQRIAEGTMPVVVGARSAIFAPTPQLGLVVLDEEHEATFKQETAPRYHARDVALFRAAAENVPLVLGSATPSLESWRRAKTAQYELVEMPRRVLGRPLPQVGTIDLRAGQANGRAGAARMGSGAISRQLHQAVAEALAAGGQVILLLNRRGFSTHIQCPACGHVVNCPECDIALTHHRAGERAICHYCDFETLAPPRCPECDFQGIHYGGLGTQRLEAEVRARFRNASCLRMDTDSMQAAGAHQRALDAFRRGEVQILLGTQMIAKGLDFPNVTLVGVINADTALHLPDFRAAERTFQLVTQVAGRTGRGPKGGRVLVQTFSPEHPAIQAAVRHNYAAFAAEELPIREMLRYPPFASMLRLVIRGPDEQAALAFATELATRLRKAAAEARVLGPAPAPFARLRGLYRFQIQLQGADGAALRAAVRQASGELKPPDQVQWIADVDPLEML